MSKPAAKSLCLLLAAIVVFYWRIVFTRRYSMLTDYETVSQAYSWFHFFAESIRHGKWPLWDPYMFGGRSFSGEMQTAVFYPLHLVFALFAPDRNGLLPVRLYHGYFVFAHALAAVFMFALVRELGLSYFAAVVGGLCFSVGGFMGQVPWPHLLESASWTPLLFLLLLRAWKAADARRAAIYAALAGLALGLSVLAGGLHIVFMQGILLAAAALYRAFHDRGVWRKTLSLAALAIVVGVLACAVQLASSAEYSAHALRFVGASGAIPATEKIPLANLDAVSPRLLLSYFVYSNPHGTLDGTEALDPYLGILPLFFAIVGFWKCRRYPWVGFFAALAIVAMIYSLGRTTWLYSAVYYLVPYLWMARESTRFLFLAHFGLVILAAYGCDVLLLKRSWGLWLLTLAIILVNLNVYSFVALNRKDVALTGTDYYERLRSFRGPAEFLRRQPGLFRVRVLADPGLNMGDAYAIQTLNGGAVTMPSNYFELINKTADGARLLNTRYIIRPASVTDPNPVYADATWKIYEDPQARPRAWLAHQAAADQTLVTGYAAEKISVQLHAGNPDLLVLSEMFDPGWIAFVNGARVPIEQVYGGLRGIAVPAGDSRIVVEYRPAPVLIGAAVTLLTFLLVLWSALWFSGLSKFPAPRCAPALP